MSESLRFLEDLTLRLRAEADEDREIPEATPPVSHRRLCIGMSTFDDYDGVYFTIQALRLSQPEVMDDTSFLILDNHPEGPAGTALRDLAGMIPDCRYLPFNGYRGTATRDLIFREADADIVLCLDSHVLLVPGSLTALLAYFDADPESKDLVQGPILNDELTTVHATHFNPTWGGGMWGQWENDPRGADPAEPAFDIEMQGLGLFACRRAAWPGFNPRLRQFGAEEGYLHEKIRRAGGRTVCLPALRWAHRFRRTGSATYGMTWHSRIRNYYIAWDELGWDRESIDAHFREHLGLGADDPSFDHVATQVDSPFSFFDAILYTGPDPEMDDRFRQLDIAWRAERVASREAALTLARERDFQSVLLVDGDVRFLDQTLLVLADAVADLPGDWATLHLGGDVEPGAYVPGSDVLKTVVGAGTSPALALRAPFTGGPAYVTAPHLATDPAALATVDAIAAERFVIR